MKIVLGKRNVKSGTPGRIIVYFIVVMLIILEARQNLIILF